MSASDLTARLNKTARAAAAARGYAVEEIAAGATIDLICSKGGAGFVVWLEAADETKRAFARTRHCNVGHRGDPPDRAGFELMKDLCARLRAWEGDFDAAAWTALFAAPTAREATPDWLPHLEWLAVESGLKPASRNVASTNTTNDLLAEARRRGLRAEVLHAGDFIGGFCAGNRGMDAIVYAARAETELRAVVAAERALMEADARRERAPDELIQRLGAALGYPPCCIDAFLPLRDLANGVIRFRALGATAGAPSFLLNDTIEGRVLVSHAVCRYDCAASIDLGQRLLAAMSRTDPGGAAALVERLRGFVCLFANGAVLRLVPRPGESADDVFPFSAVEAYGEGAHHAHWRAELGDADSVRRDATGLVLLRSGREIRRLDAPPDTVRLALFC